jgi:hypothetical protein
MCRPWGRGASRNYHGNNQQGKDGPGQVDALHHLKILLIGYLYKKIREVADTH